MREGGRRAERPRASTSADHRLPARAASGSPKRLRRGAAGVSRSLVVESRTITSSSSLPARDGRPAGPSGELPSPGPAAVAPGRAHRRHRRVATRRDSNPEAECMNDVASPRPWLLPAADYKSSTKPIWCPGCADFHRVGAITKALAELVAAAPGGRSSRASAARRGSRPPHPLLRLAACTAAPWPPAPAWWPARPDRARHRRRRRRLLDRRQPLYATPGATWT